jgi:hypothetical protein
MNKLIKMVELILIVTTVAVTSILVGNLFTLMLGGR